MKNTKLTPADFRKLADELDKLAKGVNANLYVGANAATPPELCFVDRNTNAVVSIYQQGEMSAADFYAWVRDQLFFTAGRIKPPPAADLTPAPARADIMNWYGGRDLIVMAFESIKRNTPTTRWNDDETKLIKLTAAELAKRVGVALNDVVSFQVRKAIREAEAIDAAGIAGNPARRRNRRPCPPF